MQIELTTGWGGGWRGLTVKGGAEPATGSRPHLVEQVRQRVVHAVVAHVETNERQVSAIRVEVVQTLLVGGAVRPRCSLGPLATAAATALMQGVLQLPQGRQDVLTTGLRETDRQTDLDHESKPQGPYTVSPVCKI